MSEQNNNQNTNNAQNQNNIGDILSSFRNGKGENITPEVKKNENSNDKTNKNNKEKSNIPWRLIGVGFAVLAIGFAFLAAFVNPWCGIGCVSIIGTVISAMKFDSQNLENNLHTSNNDKTKEEGEGKENGKGNEKTNEQEEQKENNDEINKTGENKNNLTPLDDQSNNNAPNPADLMTMFQGMSGSNPMGNNNTINGENNLPINNNEANTSKNDVNNININNGINN